RVAPAEGRLGGACDTEARPATPSGSPRRRDGATGRRGRVQVDRLARTLGMPTPRGGRARCYRFTYRSPLVPWKS
ncbi:hypothetical protein, partial [Streptomyces sp. NPDC004285]